MITKNFKARVATLLQMSTSTGGSQKGLVSVKDTSGTTRYLSCYTGQNYPTSMYIGVSFYSASDGIWIGSGNTAAAEDDYCLESQITSGLNASSVTSTYGVDSSGNPYVECLFTLTNTTSSDIVVREIGYVQPSRLSDTQGATASSTNRHLLLDRTVLTTPVTVPANDSAAVKYTLKTVLASS